MLRDHFEISMIAEQPGEVRSNAGPRTSVDITLADASGFDVLIVPGGWGTRAGVKRPDFLELLKARADEAKVVASVCTGSALLAKAGVLDGKRATSNKLAFDWVTSQGPNVKWVREARWVEDDKFFTSSGVSAGMDMTLGFIQHLHGRDTAVKVARWAEYTWHEDKSFDPFASIPTPG